MEEYQTRQIQEQEANIVFHYEMIDWETTGSLSRMPQSHTSWQFQGTTQSAIDGQNVG
jgi:hypothetical protein